MIEFTTLRDFIVFVGPIFVTMNCSFLIWMYFKYAHLKGKTSLENLNASGKKKVIEFLNFGYELYFISTVIFLANAFIQDKFLYAIISGTSFNNLFAINKIIKILEKLPAIDKNFK